MFSFCFFSLFLFCVLQLNVVGGGRKDTLKFVSSKHKCLIEFNEAVEIRMDGMFQSVVDLVVSWKLQKVSLIIIQSEDSALVWDLHLIARMFESQTATTVTQLHQINTNASISQIKVLIENQDTFALFGWTQFDVANFMHLVDLNLLVNWNHIWMIGSQESLIAAEVLTVRPIKNSCRIRAQYVILSPKNDTLQANCREIRLMDVFHVEGKNSWTSVEFGEWTHRLGLVLFEELRGDDKVLELQQKLVIGIGFEFPLIFMVRNESKEILYAGYVINIVQLLSEHLHFRLLINMNTAFSPGTKINNTYTGNIGALFERKADLSLNFLSMTADRHEGMFFLPYIISGGMGLWHQSPVKVVSPVAHVLTFSPTVWLLIFVATFLLLTFFTLSVIHRWSLMPTKDRNLNSFEKTFRETRGISSKVFFGVFLVFSLIVSTYYNSVLMSFLTYSMSSIPFDNLEELLAEESFQLTLMEHTSHYELFSNSESGIFHEVWQRIVSGGQPLITGWDDVVSTICKSPNLVVLYDYASTTYETEPYECRISVTTTNLMTDFEHIGTRKEFPYNRLFSRTVLRMNEYGILNHMIQRNFSDDPNLMDVSDNGEPSTLQLRHFTVPFYVLAGGVFLSFFVFVFELAVSRIVKARKKSLRQPIE